MVKAEITLSVEIFDINVALHGGESKIPAEVVDKLLMEASDSLLRTQGLSGKFMLRATKVRHMGVK